MIISIFMQALWCANVWLCRAAQNKYVLVVALGIAEKMSHQFFFCFIDQKKSNKMLSNHFKLIFMAFCHFKALQSISSCFNEILVAFYWQFNVKFLLFNKCHRRHDTRHNGIQFKGTHHNSKSKMTLSITSLSIWQRVVMLIVVYVMCHFHWGSQIRPFCWVSLCWMS